MTLAIPVSSSRSVWSRAWAGERSKPRASRSGDSSSKSHRGRRGVGASATAQAFTTWLDRVVGVAVGCPGPGEAVLALGPHAPPHAHGPTLGRTADRKRRPPRGTRRRPRHCAAGSVVGADLAERVPERLLHLPPLVGTQPAPAGVDRAQLHPREAGRPDVAEVVEGRAR